MPNSRNGLAGAMADPYSQLSTYGGGAASGMTVSVAPNGTGAHANAMLHLDANEDCQHGDRVPKDNVYGGTSTSGFTSNNRALMNR